MLLDLDGCLGLSLCIYHPDLDNAAAAARICAYTAQAAAALPTTAG